MFPYGATLTFLPLTHVPILALASMIANVGQFIERDSLKDETVVVIFIFATAGLLAWALVKPWVDRLRLRNERRDFAPLVGSESNEGPHTPSGHTQAPARGGGNGNGRGGGRRGASTRFVDADEDAVDIGSGSTAGVVH